LSHYLHVEVKMGPIATVSLQESTSAHWTHETIQFLCPQTSHFIEPELWTPAQ